MAAERVRFAEHVAAHPGCTLIDWVADTTGWPAGMIADVPAAPVTWTDRGGGTLGFHIIEFDEHGAHRLNQLGELVVSYHELYGVGVPPCWPGNPCGNCPS